MGAVGRVQVCVIAAAMGGFCPAALAQTIESLGVLDGGNDSRALAVDGTGSVIVGYSQSSDGVRAFRWTEASGMESLGVLAGGLSSQAHGISSDGSVIVGQSESSVGTRAFRWTEAGGMVSLGTLTGGAQSEALGISGDGTVIVGFSDSTSGDRAFRWTQSGGMVSLGVLTGGTESFAESTNDDGSVVVGVGDTAGGTRGFRWTASGGMQNLGTLDGTGASYAVHVSGDGAVVVGRSDSVDGTRAFRWTAAGGMVSLGTLEGGSESQAAGVNDDGSVIVGRSESDEGTRAFRWTAAGGMESLGTLEGGSFSTAFAVSGDGRVIVGESNSSVGGRAFMYITQMQDLANVQSSLLDLANGYAVSIDRNTHIARRLRQETCEIDEDAQACVGVRGLASSLLQGANTFGGDIYGAIDVSERLTLGGAVGLYGESRVGQTIDPTLGVGLGGFAAYELGTATWGDHSFALGARVDGAWFHTQADVNRGRGYTDVQQVDGDTAFNSGTVGAWLTGAYALSPRAVLEPFVGAYWEATFVEGYAEDASSDAAVRLDGDSVNAASFVAGLGVDVDLSQRLALFMGVAAEADFYSDGVAVSGRSDVPGLAEFTIGADTPHNWVRGIVDVGLGYDLGRHGAVIFSGEIYTPRYERKLGGDVSLSYTLSF